MDNFSDSDQAHYEIQVKGHLSERWSSAFDGLVMATGFSEDGTPITTLSGPIADQAALHGMLARIRDMGMELLAVNRVETGEEKDGPTHGQHS